MLDMIEDIAIQRPALGLAPYIARYVGYRMEGFAPGIHRGLPSRHLTFIVSLDRPVEMMLTPPDARTPSGHPDTAAPTRPMVAMQSFVSGLQTWAAHVLHDGNQHGIAVELTPLGAAAVLGVPGGDLAGQVIALDDLLGARSRELTARLLDADTWPARFTILDDLLSRGLRRRYLPSGEVRQAWSRLVTGRGATDVEALAREIGWSRRHLTEQVRREVGLPPRQLNRVLRFERSCALLRRTARGTLTDVAMGAGYFDHAHMVHEWRRLAGCTPSEWLSEELPSVQDPDDMPAGYWEHEYINSAQHRGAPALLAAAEDRLALRQLP
jgi:AraC-like DNA-binding protein